MAKTYAQSVKLPNLVAVPHPSTKFLPRDGLNVEGRSSCASAASASGSVSASEAASRRELIRSLMDEAGGRASRRRADSLLVNSEQVMELIDEKLTTGYHGVRHLFRANDPGQTGQLSKESFRCILNQLCGYISSEAWNRLLPRFGLDLKDTISFDEFISYFEDNPKVKKELAASVELMNLAKPTPIVEMRPKNTAAPNLSAAYCFALMKAKARSLDFEPRDYLPDECFERRGLVMPFHLAALLKAWSLQLGASEFQKLWERFDLKNVGGVKTRLFLRLIDYNPNEVETLGRQNNLLRTKSCIGDLNSATKADAKADAKAAQPSHYYLQQIIEYDPNDSEPSPFDTRFLKKVDQVAEKPAEPSEEPSEAKAEEKKDAAPVVAPEPAAKKRVQSTLSESRIKSMAQLLKSSSKFGPSDDLVAHVNNKLNHGYISFKTAFEYVDPDHLGHLLKDEFAIVLREFGIAMDADTYDAFLKKHALIKHNQLVDYQKFLQIFQSLAESGLTVAYMKAADAKAAANSQLKQAEQALVDFFHDFYYVLLGFFKEKCAGETCSVDFLKRLLEQKLVILVDQAQLDGLLRFVGLHEEAAQKTGQITWMALFKKFGEIDPWQCFKDSCETALQGLKPFHARRTNEPKTETQVVVKSLDQVPPRKQAAAPKPAAVELVAMTTAKTTGVSSSSPSPSSSDDEDEELKGLDTVRASTNRLLRSSTLGSVASGVKLKNTFDTMRLGYLEKSVELLFRTKFHSVNKYFTLLDPNHTERLDREKFRVLMQKSGLKLSATDVVLLWRDFEAESIPFSNLVRRFFRPDEFNRLRNIKEKIRLDKRIKEHDEHHQQHAVARSTQPSATSNGTSSVEQTSVLFSSLSGRVADKAPASKAAEKRIDHDLLARARPLVAKNWPELRRDFQQADKLSSTHCTNTKAVEILKRNQVALSDKELFDLCAHFSFNESAADVDYIRLLRHFNGSRVQTTTPAAQLEPPKWKSLNPTLRRIIIKLREQNAARSAESTNALVGDLNNLRVAFKKFDPVRKGHLTSAEFKELLKTCALSVSLDDMYMMFSEFDPDLRGVFNYELFIKSLIDKSLTSD